MALALRRSYRNDAPVSAGSAPADTTDAGATTDTGTTNASASSPGIASRGASAFGAFMLLLARIVSLVTMVVVVIIVAAIVLRLLNAIRRTRSSTTFTASPAPCRPIPEHVLPQQSEGHHDGQLGHRCPRVRDHWRTDRKAACERRADGHWAGGAGRLTAPRLRALAARERCEDLGVAREREEVTLALASGQLGARNALGEPLSPAERHERVSSTLPHEYGRRDRGGVEAPRRIEDAVVVLDAGGVAHALGDRF